MAAPLLSVIVPTRNRRHLVLALIKSLTRQVDPRLPFELIVVDDGSTDGTVASLRSLAPPFELLVIEQRPAGAASARNAGAAQAQGDILVFLDDDMEPLEGALAAHSALHARATGCVGLGDIPPVAEDGSFLATIVRGWWLGMRPGIGHPGYRYGIRDVLTGHLSIRREHFAALGGFDSALRCHEDWEFGYRAMRAGLDLRFLRGAVAIHHDENAFNLHKVIGRKFDEGVADLQLVRRHPKLAPALPLAWPVTGRRRRVFHTLAFRAPRIGDVVAAGVLRSMRVYEAANLRFRWRARIEAVLFYHYWRGVASVVDQAELREIVMRGVPDVQPLTLDLAAGLEAAARQLEAHRPESVILVHADDHIGTVASAPGYERLAGRHLAPLLAGGSKGRYVQALARSGKVPSILLDAVKRGERHDRTRCDDQPADIVAQHDVEIAMQP